MGRLACIVILLAAAPVAAQEPGTAQEPGAGQPVAIATGFTPDPAQLVGRAGGPVRLSTLAPSCGGYAATEPNHVLSLDSGFGFLRLFVIAPQRVTLAVRGPDGGWRCSTARRDHTALQEGRYAAGRYEVFVGSPEPGTMVEYELSLTEFHGVGPGQSFDRGGPTLDIGLEVAGEEARFQVRRFRRGFLPDPREDGGTAGGEIDARLLGADCRGFVDARPSHLLTLRNDFDYLRVQLGDASGEATIVLLMPGGRYLCSAPEEENAHVDQDAWPAGDYRIWIGAREREATADYRICYTEVRPAEGSIMCGTDRMGRGNAAENARAQRAQ